MENWNNLQKKIGSIPVNFSWDFCSNFFFLTYSVKFEKNLWNNKKIRKSRKFEIFEKF